MDRLSAYTTALLLSALITLSVIPDLEAGKCSGRWAIHACAGGAGKRSQNLNSFRWSDFFGLDDSHPKRRPNELPDRTETSQPAVDQPQPAGLWIDEREAAPPADDLRNGQFRSTNWPLLAKEVKKWILSTNRNKMTPFTPVDARSAAETSPDGREWYQLQNDDY